MKLKQNTHYDWDWHSFSKNILKPNREHIKIALNIDDKKIELLLSDGYVFLNDFEGSWDEDDDECGVYPNFKNFIERPIDELDY